jgi:hypothetical protein
VNPQERFAANTKELRKERGWLQADRALTDRRIEEHHTENAILESMLVRTGECGRWVPELKIHCAFGAKKNKRKLAITDALISLDAADLIERRSGHLMASEVARRLDEMML